MSCGWICVLLWVLKDSVLLNPLSFPNHEETMEAVRVLMGVRSIAKMAAFFALLHPYLLQRDFAIPSISFPIP